MQTPVLAMIVERDDAILQFRPQLFWELTTRYREVVFKYTGKRFEKPEKAQVLLEKIIGQPFAITGIVAKEKKEQPPQLFDLTTLQREINKLHGLSAADTLAATQNLYEKKFVTYPRTDSRYLSKDLQPRIPKILAQLKALRPEEIAPLNLAKLPFSKRIIDDTKVSDHHAIIPTGVTPRGLSAHEQLVYEAITTQFIAAFYPVCIKNITTVDGVSNGVKFEAKGTQVVEPGWTVLFPNKKTGQDAAEEQTLPAFCKGRNRPPRAVPARRQNHPAQALHAKTRCSGPWRRRVNSSRTIPCAKRSRSAASARPPPVRPSSKPCFSRDYIQREKKQLRCTDMGRCLIALIRDPLLKSPEMTGEWEEKLKKIERSQLDPDEFMAGITGYIRTLIRARHNGAAGHRALGQLPALRQGGGQGEKGLRLLGLEGWVCLCPRTGVQRGNAYGQTDSDAAPAAHPAAAGTGSRTSRGCSSSPPRGWSWTCGCPRPSGSNR